MKVLHNGKQTIIFRFDSGESVWDKLLTYCKENKLTSGTFSAIGASREVTLSYYDLANKHYKDTNINKDLEILTITGNIALLDEQYVIHAHGSFGKADLSVIGGHIKKLVVSATCELSLQLIETNLHRGFDETTGLNLLK